MLLMFCLIVKKIQWNVPLKPVAVGSFFFLVSVRFIRHPEPHKKNRYGYEIPVP